jgi:hypothetical protein
LRWRNLAQPERRVPLGGVSRGRQLSDVVVERVPPGMVLSVVLVLVSPRAVKLGLTCSLRLWTGNAWSAGAPGWRQDLVRPQRRVALLFLLLLLVLVALLFLLVLT